MTLDDFLPPALQSYIVDVTTAESTLLKNLTEETKTSVGMIQMLTGPIEGQFLHLLTKISKSKICLELGTFTGYSALNIASALPIDGRLITCEMRENHAKIAQKYFDMSPHGHKIQIKLGLALDTIQTLTDTFDLIFIDADKANYPAYYDLLIPKLNRHGLMIIDNALWGGEVVAPADTASKAIDTLNQKASIDDRVDTVMLTIRDGMLLIQKR